MSARAEGRARRLGDDINTDYIIASTRKRDTLDERELTRYLLETVDPAFAGSVRPGDIIVAGANFGCGSAMEIATTVIQAAGIQCVIASSFARTFYRNAVNNGLLAVECETGRIAEGDRVRVVEADGVVTVVVGGVAGGISEIPGTVPAGIAGEILAAGGLVPYLRQSMVRGFARK